MPRRYLATVLAVAIFAVATVHASDFWVSKDWKQWSSHECGVLLADSPWAHTWKGGRPETLIPGVDISSRVGLSADSGVGLGDRLTYTIQLRSSLTVREAIVRQLQFDQKYDKMADDQRKAFDDQAAKIINRNYDDTILVHFDFSNISDLGLLGAQRHALIENRNRLSVLLLAEDGSQLEASRVDVKPTDLAFDAIFPRIVNGASVIKAGQKEFSIRFQNPQVMISKDEDIPAQFVQVKFDLTKMVIGGKPSY